VKLLHPLIPPGRRARTTAVALTVAAVSLIGFGPVAQASTVARTATVAAPLVAAPSSSAGVNSRTFIVPRPANLHDDTMGPDTTYITCTIDVDDPNAVPGADIEADGVVSCSGTVYQIVIETALFYGPSSTLESSAVLEPINTAYVFDTTYATPLVGDWQAGAVADVYPTASPSYTQIGPVYSIVEDVS
jgi:hypothetical protein